MLLFNGKAIWERIMKMNSSTTGEAKINSTFYKLLIKET